MLNNFSEPEKIALLARYDFLDLCILGETGTGKTHLARLIHNTSPRKDNPFVAVNCAELTPSIIESELFGYEKGAFTGALSSKEGKFEQAAGGTLFLDEIGELSKDLQAKLLKVVEEKSVTRVGGNRTRQVDVRIIYATHRDLSVLREDLRYRVAAAYTIHLKPLRERRWEIVPFARLFISEFSRRSGRVVKANDETLRLLEASDWRGNVRELQSFVEKACLRALLAADQEEQTGDAVELTDEILLARLSTAPAQSQQPQSAKFFSVSDKFPIYMPGEKMDDYLDKIERQLLKNAMEKHDNNQTHAARHLGISRSGLIKKLKRMSH
jgi:transcriptional regulator with GAF, ATPase, and Fis domain